MARQADILAMAARLSSAAGNGDWTALAAANSALAPTLATLAAQGAWSEAERGALRTLRAAHQQAYRDCSEEKERLARRLSDMQTNKEGWIAYALYGELDPHGNWE